VQPQQQGFVCPPPLHITPLTGILTLQAPRKQLSLTGSNPRAIPITHVAHAPMLGEKNPAAKKLTALNGS
jgi:hypothetical protein